jgi:hypothetical protein
MKSSIKIDFVDRGTGIGVEPVIRIELIKSEDPRDTLIQVLFESLQSQSFLQFRYTNHKRVLLGGEADYEKQILLFKPETDMQKAMEIVWEVFREWVKVKKYKVSKALPEDNDAFFENGNGRISQSKLFNEFVESKKINYPEVVMK